MGANDKAVWLLPIGLILSVVGMIFLGCIDGADFYGAGLVVVGIGCWLASIGARNPASPTLL